MFAKTNVITNKFYFIKKLQFPTGANKKDYRRDDNNKFW